MLWWVFHVSKPAAHRGAGIRVFPTFKKQRKKPSQISFLNPPAGISNTGRRVRALAFAWEEQNSWLLDKVCLTTLTGKAELCLMLHGMSHWCPAASSSALLVCALPLSSARMVGWFPSWQKKTNPQSTMKRRVLAAAEKVQGSVLWGLFVECVFCLLRAKSRV